MIKTQITLLKSLTLISFIVLSLHSCSTKTFNLASSEKTNAKQIIGTWQLCNAKDSLVITNFDHKDGQKRIKIITPATFTVIDYIDSPNEMYAAFMGSYNLKSDYYTETIEHTGRGYQRYLNEKNTFMLEIDGDYMTICAADNNYGPELWKRVK